MSDNTETAEQETPVVDETTTEDEPAAETNPSREAAKYRTRLRATEAERDNLKEQLLDARRGELETELGNALRNPADLFNLSGTGPEDYLREDLSLDVDKATEAVEQLITDRPELARITQIMTPGTSETITSVKPAASPLEVALRNVKHV